VKSSIKVPFLDLRFQYTAIQDEIESATLRVLRSGQYILGPELKRFESEFASYLNVPHAMGVASGTDALELALRVLEIGPGDDVLTVGNICAPTICAILATGARPVLIDIDPLSYNMSPKALAAYLQNNRRNAKSAKVILPIHLYGRMADMVSIRQIADEYQLKIVEDAAQAHGARLGSQHAGTLGDIGCFSMYPTKNLGACGDAGMIVTGDDLTANRLRMLRNYGEVAKYENREQGINSRLDEIQAAILQVKLKYIDDWTRRRMEIASRYDELFYRLGIRDDSQISLEKYSHVYHQYVISVRDRDRFRMEMQNLGVATSVHYPKPIHHQTAFRNQCRVADNLKYTEMACHSVVSLPLYPELTVTQVSHVCDSVQKLFRSRQWMLQNTA
jgi:dTDP-4-amino-4,6-dideoxygalactose transaminase